MIDIRRARSDDAPAIEELLSQVLDIHHEIRPDLFKSGARKYTRRQLEQLIADDRRPIFVAEDDGKVTGYAFCIFERHVNDNILTDIGSLYIDDLCVDSHSRGRHIGRRLYEYVLEFARANGCYNVTLNVWQGNDSAMSFYNKMGLKPQKIHMEVIL